MRYLIIVLSFFLITCGGGGGGSPTEPTPPQLPTVQNIEFTTPEDTPKTFAFMGSEPQNLALTYGIATQPEHGTVSLSGGAGTYTPNANYNGADTFYYLATSVSGNSNIGTVVVTITPVDDEPNTMDATAVTDEDNAVSITLSAEEVDGDNIQFNVVNNPSNGSVTISGTTAIYTPNQDWYGTDSFNFEAVDVSSKAILNTATATITVNPINDAPTVDDMNIESPQDVPINIHLSGSDVENDNLTFSIVDNPTNGTLSIDGNVVTFSSSVIGVDTFTYKANDGTDDSNIGTVSVDIQENKFQATFGGSANDIGYYVEQTTYNGGYVLIGMTENAGKAKCYLVKTDALGNILTENMWLYGGVSDSECFSGKVTSDGGYILAGRTASGTSSDGIYRMYVVKTDISANTEWTSSFSPSNYNSFVRSITESNDGKYIFTGYSETAPGDFDIVLGQIDASGILEWMKFFNGPTDPDDDGGMSVKNTSDGGYIIGAHSNGDSYLIKTDSQGNEEWSNVISNSDANPQEIIQTSDGGYAFVSIINGGTVVLFVKTDSSGNEEWNQTYQYASKNTHAYSLKQTSDGGYIIGGFTDTNNALQDICLIKIDASGTQQWIKLFGTNRHEYFGHVQLTIDGGYILVGSTTTGSNSTDMYLIKTDSQGNRIF